MTINSRFDLPQETLQDLVRYPHAFDCSKHDLAPDPVSYADMKINRMSNAEFLEALSAAIEEIRA